MNMKTDEEAPLDLPANNLKHALRSGRPLVGFWTALCSNIAAEIVGGAGFDWVVIDGEHTPNDVASTLAQLQALSASTAAPIVRLPSNDASAFKRLLDIGATSFLVPLVESREQAEAAVAATRYPPRGTRGVYLANRGGRFGRVPDYFRRAEQEICVLLQVESRKGLENLENIASVTGVDGIFIGTSDLAADLGHIGDPGHPTVEGAVLEAIARLRKIGLPGGTLAAGRLGFSELVAAGFTFISVGTDIGLLVSQTDALVRATRGRGQAGQPDPPSGRA